MRQFVETFCKKSVFEKKGKFFKIDIKEENFFVNLGCCRSKTGGESSAPTPREDFDEFVFELRDDQLFDRAKKIREKCSFRARRGSHERIKEQEC